MPERLPLATIVLTRDEERHLPECLGSVAGLGQRVLVVDSGSRDATPAIARRLGAELVEHPFKGYASQRQAALNMVEEEWVLFLDADERLTAPLRAEIARAIREAPPEVDGYWIPRRNWIRGRELSGGGWSPDRQLRLLRRRHARYLAGREVHEVAVLDGESGELREPLLHLNYDSLAEFRHKQAAYAALRAVELAAAGPPRRRGYLGQPARELWRRFVTLGGYRDGPLGFTLACLMAWYELRARVAADRLPQRALGAGTVALAPAELDLSVVIVSFNVRDLLLNCLASLEASLAESPLRYEVIVVDNASPDGSADAVRRRFPEVRLLERGGNAGFAAANNDGVRAARGAAIALLNPDTTVVGNALQLLAGYLWEQPEVGVVGPRLVYPNGATQSSRRRFPTRLTGFLESTAIQEYWHDNRVLRRYYLTDRGDDETQDVDWLVGACLVARREAIAEAGLFDERFFMYSEEVEWCHRVRAAGWRIVYLPPAVIVHHEGASSGQNVPARQVHFDTSKVLLYQQLYGKPTARVLRAFLLGSYLLRVAIEGGKGLIGHKRALRRERVRLYLAAFRSRLRPGGTP